MLFGCADTEQEGDTMNKEPSITINNIDGCKNEPTQDHKNPF